MKCLSSDKLRYQNFSLNPQYVGFYQILDLPPPTPLTKPMLMYPKLYVVITAKCLKLQNRCIRVIFGAFWELFGAF